MTEEAQEIIDELNKRLDYASMTGDAGRLTITPRDELGKAIQAAATKPKGPFPFQLSANISEVLLGNGNVGYHDEERGYLGEIDRKVKDAECVAWLLHRGVDLQDLYIDVLEGRIDRDEDDALRAILKNAEEN